MPTAPAPMTMSDAGRASALTAPFEEMIWISSMVVPGNDLGSEPVARITARRASRVCAPSLPFTSTRFLALRMPEPATRVILFLRKRNSTPLAMRSATRRDRWRAWVGMQPQLRHTPPGRSSYTAATERPSCAHRMAATYPPGPVPTTTTSKAWFATGLDEEAQRLFEETLHVLEEACPHGAVHHPVVARDGHLHASPHPDLAALGHGLLEHGAHRENGAFGRVDDGGKFLHVVHAELGYGEGRSGEFLGA